MLLATNIPFPGPPAPSDFAPYGFAGLIFAAFFFLVCGIFWLGSKYLNTRDAAQDRRDSLMAETVKSLGASHEKAVERVAASTEKVGESSARAHEAVTSALRDLQKEVQNSHRIFGEETFAGIVRRAVREVKGEK